MENSKQSIKRRKSAASLMPDLATMSPSPIVVAALIFPAVASPWVNERTAENIENCDSNPEFNDQRP
jgi:hypothetical protein